MAGQYKKIVVSVKYPISNDLLLNNHIIAFSKPLEKFKIDLNASTAVFILELPAITINGTEQTDCNIKLQDPP